MAGGEHPRWAGDGCGADHGIATDRTNPVTVNDVLDGHTQLEINFPDRVYLTLSVPNLMVGGQVVSFLTQHEKAPIPSPAMLERRGQAFRRAVASYAQAHDIPLISFAGEEG